MLPNMMNVEDVAKFTGLPISAVNRLLSARVKPVRTVGAVKYWERRTIREWNRRRLRKKQ